MMTDPATLRAFLIKKMDETGMSQTDIASASGLTISDINGIFKGRIQLPGAGKRRDLARALGVSHLDILIAADEIRADEIEPLRVQGVIADDPVRNELIDRLRRVRLTPRRVKTLDSILDLMLGTDAEERSEEVAGALKDHGID
jgi:transcriptional regulator with XRE-family HTH domain